MQPLSILLIGSGGREHALAWKLSQSLRCAKLFIAPGNPGTAHCGTNVALPVADHAAVIAFCKEQDIGLVMVGPEAPLAAGLIDDLTAVGIKAFGPTKAAAQLESSKGFTKDLCREADIPTAAYARFDNHRSALAYIRQHGAPIVIKADGLAAGKGVVVAMTLDEAEAALTMMFEGSLGQAGAQVVIEAFLSGEEASFFALCDGTTAIPFGTAQDHKRAFDGDQGPNTGGMGAYSPAPVLNIALQDEVMRTIIAPTLKAMAEKGMPYTGILYAGLMITDNGPFLIEYNARLGDPETQVLMPRLASDLVTLLLAACNQELTGQKVEWHPHSALTVVMAAQGYPGPVQPGSVIAQVEAAAELEDVLVFHAGTRQENGQLVAAGGRVLNVTGLGTDIAQAQARAYAGAEAIDWPQGFYRRDIGWRALQRD